MVLEGRLRSINSRRRSQESCLLPKCGDLPWRRLWPSRFCCCCCCLRQSEWHSMPCINTIHSVLILDILTLTSLWAYSADDQLMIIILFSPWNRLWHFMLIETLCMEHQSLFPNGTIYMNSQSLSFWFLILRWYIRKINTVAMFSKEFCSGRYGSKCLHATLSNAPFCTHYVDDATYCSLITVTFP